MNGALFIYKKSLFVKKVLCFLRTSNTGVYWLSLLEFDGETVAITTFEGVRLLIFTNVSCHVDVGHICEK